MLRDWDNEDVVRFERIRRNRGPGKKDKRTTARYLHPGAGFLRACEGKHAYPRGVAKRVAARLEDEGGAEMSAYRCRYCGRYHIGHSPYRLRRAA